MMNTMQPWGITRNALRSMLRARRSTIKPDTRSTKPTRRADAIACLAMYDARIRTELRAGARHARGGMQS